MIFHYCSNWIQMAFLSLILSLIMPTSFIFITHNNLVDAYKTFELVKYCQRFDSTVKFPDERHNDDIINSGLVVPKKFHKHQDSESADDILKDYDDYDNDGYIEELIKMDSNEYAGKTVTVDAGYDSSAVRLVVDADNVFRARLRCSILVMPKKPNGLIVSLRKLRVRPGIDWLRISINNSSFTRTFSHIRINGERDSVAYVAHHGVLIEFGTKTYLPKNEPVEIEMILTSFREADLCDIDQEFDCGSFRCISNNYLCDGYNNCGDGRDENNCPMDNLTNYLIISTTLLLAAFLIFLCFCYRCCFNKRHDRGGQSQNYPPYRKQYQYLRIRTNSQPPASYMPKYNRRSQSIQSEADLPTPLNNNLRRLKFAHIGDSMPVLLPPSETSANSGGYGSTGSTYFLPYTITIGSHRGNYGLIPFGQSRRNHTQSSSSSGQPNELPEHHTFPLPQPTYPMLHAQLFTPPSHTPPPPPYTPREQPTGSQQPSQQPQPPEPTSNNQPNP